MPKPANPVARENPAEAIAFVVALAAMWGVILSSYAAWAGLLP